MNKPLVLIISLCVFGCAPQSRDIPSDAEMISNLESNFSNFEELLVMFKKDEMSVVHPNWVQPEGRLSEKRLNQYKEIFQVLKLDGGLRRWSGDSVLLIGFSSGFVFGSTSKDYMYKAEDPRPLFDSLDGLPEGLESNTTAYKYIKKDWYLTYTWDD